MLNSLVELHKKRIFARIKKNISDILLRDN